MSNDSLVDRLAAYARHAEAHTRTPPQGSPGRSGVPWAFFGLTYGFTWLVLLPGLLAARGLIASPLPDLALIALAQFGPSLAAFLLVWRLDGAAGARRLLVRAFDVRIAPRWLLPTLLLPPALAAAARLLHLSAGGALPPAPLLEQPWAILPTFAFILLLQGPVPEEFGWRGYALDRLQARSGALTSALVLGVVWGMWHLPLFFLPAAGVSVLPFGPWFAQVVASSVLVTWLYNRTGRNLLVALLWHTMNNLALALFPTLDLVPGADPRGFVVQAVLYVLTAAAVVLIWARVPSATGAGRSDRARGCPRHPPHRRPRPELEHSRDDCHGTSIRGTAPAIDGRVGAALGGAAAAAGATRGRPPPYRPEDNAGSPFGLVNMEGPAHAVS